LAVVILPVHGTVNSSAGIHVFHDVDLPAGGPPDRSDVVAKHPEGGPDSLERWHGDACLHPSVTPGFPALCFHPRGRVLHAAKGLAPGGDNQLTIGRGCILTTVILQFIIPPTSRACTGLKHPVCADTIRKFILPHQLPVLGVKIHAGQDTGCMKEQA
jgi:hypothetical protein